MRRLDSRRLLVCLSSIAFSALIAGCGDAPGPQPYRLVADLQVTWAIGGLSNNPGDCDTFGIDQWIAMADGPESRESMVDCRASAWSSEGDFFAISEGTYRISVHALRGGIVIASQSVSYEVIDTGGVQPVHFEFVPSDFPP